MPDSVECFICGDHRPNSLEEHHIVPRRYNGSDEPENLVQLCSSCHSAIEKIYDESFYERLGAKSVEHSANEEIDPEGTKLEPHKTKDRKFPAGSVHISKENFSLNIAFSQFMYHPSQELISDYYPESDLLIKRLEKSADEIISWFKNNKDTAYTVPPDDLRRTPMVRIVDTHDIHEFDSPVTSKGNISDSPGDFSPQGQRNYAPDLSTNGLLTNDFQRLHCGYCHTVYSGNEHADLASHLRIKHRVEDPYLDRRDLKDENYSLLD